MSAFFSTNHLSLIANAAATEPADQDNAFAVLIAENLRSLFARYPHDHAEAHEMTRRDAPAFALAAEALAKYEKPPQGAFSARTLVATQIVKACDCYDYQAYETNDYDQSEAADLVRSVREEAIATGGHAHGNALYESLMWGLD